MINFEAQVRFRRTTVLFLGSLLVILAVNKTLKWKGGFPQILLQCNKSAGCLNKASFEYLFRRDDWDLGPQSLNQTELAPFDDSAQAVLDALKIPRNLSDSDLGEACAPIVWPCISITGKCVMKAITPVVDGRLSPSPSACLCFLSSMSPAEMIPGDNMALSCPFICIESLHNAFNEYLRGINGPQGQLLDCHKVINDAAKKTYGSRNDYLSSGADLEGMVEAGPGQLSVDDPLALRAARALAVHANALRKQACPLRLPFRVPPDLLYAKRNQGQGGKGDYRLEVRAVSEDGSTAELFGRVAHLPKQDQLVELQSDTSDPRDLLGRFAVLSISPDPCASGDDAVLAVSARKVAEVNGQMLGWRAERRPEHEGRTRASFASGYVPMAATQRASFFSQLADVPDADAGAAAALPLAFDARDRRAGQTPCRAFGVQNQGMCGACYAFGAAAAYSARLCVSTNRSWNVLLSPQDIMDCTNGCDGGDPLRVFQSMTRQSTTDDWCDPYTERKDACGQPASCEGLGNAYSVLEGSVRRVGGTPPIGGDGGVEAAAASARQMMLEVLHNGPGIASVRVQDDMFVYASGVYTRSSGAVDTGGLHAMMLVGWGTEPPALGSRGRGVDYWLLQNSWGPSWGEAGTMRIRRGVDELGIEGGGLVVARPAPPPAAAACPELARGGCLHGGARTRRCGCRCTGAWTGPTCAVCRLATTGCQNGGVLLAGTCRCACPPGFEGEACEGGVWMEDPSSPVFSASDATGGGGPEGAGATGVMAEAVAGVACAGERRRLGLRIRWWYAGTTSPPTQGSFVGIYYRQANLTTDQKLSSEYLCGPNYDSGVNAGRCPKAGSVTLFHPPMTAGHYKLVLVQFQPPNNLGQQGYPAIITDQDVVGFYTVLHSSECTTANRMAVANETSPTTLLEMRLVREETTNRVHQRRMDRRLDIVARLATSASNPAASRQYAPPPAPGPSGKGAIGTGDSGGGGGNNREVGSGGWGHGGSGETSENGVTAEGGDGGSAAVGIFTAPEPDPSVMIAGVDWKRPVVWSSGAPPNICYTLPRSRNTNPKYVVLYAGDGTDGLFFPTGLEGLGPNAPLPGSSSDCVKAAFSPGLMPGPYMIQVETEYLSMAALSFHVAFASVAIEGFRRPKAGEPFDVGALDDDDDDGGKVRSSLDGALLRSSLDDRVLLLNVSWSTSNASPKDVVRLYRSDGGLETWFFTSCGCRTSEGPNGGAARALGAAVVAVRPRRGGVTAKYFPDGMDFPAAVAPDWIDWARLCAM